MISWFVDDMLNTFLFIHIHFCFKPIKVKAAQFSVSVCHQEALATVIKAFLSLQLNLLSSPMFFLHAHNPANPHTDTLGVVQPVCFAAVFSTWQLDSVGGYY